MNYVRITTSYQDGRDIIYVSSLGLGRTIGEAEDNCEKTLFKFHPQVKPYYNGIHSCNLHSDYDFELEDVYTELRGLDKTPELMQILLDYLPTAITRRLPGIQVTSEVTTKSTSDGYVVSVDLRDRDGNEFTLDVGYGTKRAIHVSIFSDKDNRYVSDTAKGWPPECPDIRELLNQYYKYLDRVRSGKEEVMKQIKGSMRRKQESLTKKNEDISSRIQMGIDYNMFKRMCSTAAYLTEDEDYWDALWDYYSEGGPIDDAFVFFDNLFQYTEWCDVDELYEEYLDDKFKDESKSREECIQAAIDDGDLQAYKHASGNYLVIL